MTNLFNVKMVKVNMEVVAEVAKRMGEELNETNLNSYKKAVCEATNNGVNILDLSDDQIFVYLTLGTILESDEERKEIEDKWNAGIAKDLEEAQAFIDMLAEIDADHKAWMEEKYAWICAQADALTEETLRVFAEIDEEVAKRQAISDAKAEQEAKELLAILG